MKQRVKFIILKIIKLFNTILEWILLNQDRLEKDNFILGNLDVSGFYRVMYDENNLNMIMLQLKTRFEVKFIKFLPPKFSHYIYLFAIL
jgi:hypothetical protein